MLDALIRRLEGEDIHVSPHLAVKCIKSLKDRVQTQPKQEWSEEDEKMLNDILMCGERHCYLDAGNIAWLKSLKPQNKWKPSDEQMKALKEACDKYWELDGLDPLYTLYQDLKKLREE